MSKTEKKSKTTIGTDKHEIVQRATQKEQEKLPEEVLTNQGHSKFT